MLTGLFQSFVIALTGIAYYVGDFYLMQRYDRERPDEGSGRSWGYTLLMLCVLSFLITQPLALPQFGLHWASPVGLVLQMAGVVLIVLALGLHWWARVHLGRFYVEDVVLQEEHQVVNTGPYRYVRHPTFTSYFLIAGGFVLVNPAIASVGMAVYAVIDFTGAAKREEKLLAEQVKGYGEYMERTGRFFPRWADVGQDVTQSMSCLLTVPVADPDDARRRRLLNIMLAGMATLAGFGSIVLIVFSAIITPAEMLQMIAALSAAGIGVVLIYAINRWWSGDVAGTLFIFLLLTVVVVSDRPRQVVEGRTLLIFTIPILTASVVLRPWASFVVAGMSSMVITAIAQFRIGIVPPIPSMLGFFAFALVAWLSARTLENALKDLRDLNRELDQRVEERTKALREANCQLAEANERLRELDRLKSRFVSMVSHELRTPLGSIKGFVEILAAEIYGPLEERQKNALRRIEANAERLLNLVNDLLDQARIEAGQVSLDSAPFSPSSLIEEVRATMGVLASSEGLDLTTEVNADVPDMLYGDEKRLHQVLVNLVNNAIKFTDEGSVAVRLCRSGSEQWAIEVSDTGPGIPEEDQRRIFAPFQRVDDSSTREHLGVGLGLSIVKELVDLMGGHISLESEVGKGSSFIITFPLHQEEEICTS
jgi:signal transduction histidine kinase/isoprenylcysteine carboxyl methyltransferase (ICMT) family protein YpbQ